MANVVKAYKNWPAYDDDLANKVYVDSEVQSVVNGDIKNLTNTTNSITENKAATKTRAESLGAIIIGNYSNNQLVCKKDACIIKSGDFSETYSLPDFFEAHFAVIVPKT